MTRRGRGAIDRLTKRESEVLLAYVREGTAREAAVELGISEQTVKNYLYTMRRLYGFRSTTLMILAMADDLKVATGLGRRRKITDV